MLPSDLGLNPRTFPSFRPGQLELAMDLALSSHPVSCMRGPCGSGKSLMYQSAARIQGGRACFVTPQKALQDQLVRDFPDTADVRGQASYKCLNRNFLTCEVGAANNCGARNQDGDEGCPREEAMQAARRSRYVVCNTALWMTLGRMKSKDNPGLGKFDMVVFDEGHHLPEQLAEFCAVEIIEPEIEKLIPSIVVPSPSSSLQTWSTWAREAAPRAAKTYEHTDDPKTKTRLAAICRDLIELANVASDKTTQWIYQHNDGKHSFTPVWGSAHCERLLIQGTPNVIITSATLLPSVVDYLGIERELSEFIDVPSTFPIENRPFIYFQSGVSLSYKSTSSELRSLVHSYDGIMDMWRGYKGLYHTQSHKLTEQILSMTRNRRRLIAYGRFAGADCGSSGAAIEMLRESNPSKGMAVIGAGLKEGVDCPWADWQILAKMPLPNKSTDPVMRARCESIPAYYGDLIVGSIDQARGRIVRSITDRGFTYTGDGNWRWVRKLCGEDIMSTEQWIKAGSRIPGPDNR